MNDQPSLRQTGRTTRMLQEVLAAVEEGRRPIVVAGTKVNRKNIIGLYRKLGGDPNSITVVDTLPLTPMEHDGIFFDHYYLDHCAPNRRSCDACEKAYRLNRFPIKEGTTVNGYTMEDATICGRPVSKALGDVMNKCNRQDEAGDDLMLNPRVLELTIYPTNLREDLVWFAARAMRSIEALDYDEQIKEGA